MGGFAPLALAQAPGTPSGAPSSGAAAAASGGAKAAIDRPLKPASAEQRPPTRIGLQADEQGFDGLLDRFVARGDVQIDLAGGRLLADRLEYETKTRTLYIAGRVRFWRISGQSPVRVARAGSREMTMGDMDVAAGAGRRARGGGGSARRAERTAVSLETAKFIQRNIPNFEILNEEALQIIEWNRSEGVV